MPRLHRDNVRWIDGSRYLENVGFNNQHERRLSMLSKWVVGICVVIFLIACAAFAVYACTEPPKMLCLPGQQCLWCTCDGICY